MDDSQCPRSRPTPVGPNPTGSLAANRAPRSLTRTQLLLKIEQGLLAHADKALSRPLEIDDNPKHHRDGQRHPDCEGLPDSLKTSRAPLFFRIRHTQKNGAASTVIIIIISESGIAPSEWLPLLMRLHVSPEAVLAAYRAGDSPINVISPLNGYLLL